MKVIINNKPAELPRPFVTVSEMVQLQGIKPEGTAVAVNGRICRRSEWDSKQISEGDEITVISAAFGG